MIVPNLFPAVPSTRRIALIGEAPGADEVIAGRPFVGMSGRFLAALMSRAGVSLNSCFLGNISQHRPPGNDFSTFSWNGLEIQHGLTQLTEDLARFQPNIVVLCGNIALKAAKDCYNPHPLKPNSFKFKNSNWRGSLFLGEQGPFHNMKCLATLHPAYCLRDYDGTPLLQFDLRKAVRESATSALVLPSRIFLTAPTADEVIKQLLRIRTERRPTALDIEGGIGTMSCVSFCNDPSYAFIVPLTKKDGSSYFHENEEPKIWRALAETLEDGNVPKVLQNSLYDRFVLHYSYGIRVRGVLDDTMLRHWELYSELEKSLGVQASLYTDEPFYKGDRKSDNDETFYAYCCRDSAITLEINQKLAGFLTTQCSCDHYRLNISMLNPMLYMELRGIAYDEAGAASRRAEIRNQMHELQARFNHMVGFGFDWTSKDKILKQAIDLMGRKRVAINSFDTLCFNTTKPYIESAHRLHELMQIPNPTLATIGEVEDLCEVSCNLESSNQKKALFYDQLQLPVQFSNIRGKEPVPTCDYEAMLKLARECQKTSGDARLPLIHMAIELSSLSTRQQMLSINADKDGRIRCGYNIVGSNTGRVTCYESPTGSGYNLQTIPNYTNKKDAPGGVLGDRDLFLADPKYWFFQCDLAGADGWTVAAYSSMLGDPMLLDDYKFGLKPANILTLILRGLANEQTTREEFKALKKVISKDDWDYFACKRVQHGCCLTGDHEVLTPKGWKRIDQVREESILVFNQKNDEMFFEKPNHWTREIHVGNLCEIESKGVSLLCTPNHRIPVEDNGNKCFFASEVLKKKSGRIPYSGKYIGGKKQMNGRLIAAYHADGCFVEKTNTMGFHFVKERKIERLKMLLAPYEYKEYKSVDGSTTFNVKINPNDWGITKQPGAYMFDWDLISLSDYIEEVQHWDANISESGNIRFSSAKKETIDWIQTFSHLVEKGSVYQGTAISGFGSLIYKCSINNRKYASIQTLDVRKEISSVRAMVYCPTVSTGFFVYRRKNKIGVTGNSYLEGALTVSRNILKDSEGKLYMSVPECEQLKTVFFTRYRGIRLWHDWIARRLKEKPVLTAASGQVRQFFGRPDEILTKAVAFEPQANTTYATNLAMHNLWTDKDNRVQRTNGIHERSDKAVNLRARSSILRIEPLHQVHDALCGQFPKSDTQWATPKIKSYFDNEMLIAGQKITIPYDGGFGTSWGSLTEGSL